MLFIAAHKLTLELLFIDYIDVEILPPHQKVVVKLLNGITLIKFFLNLKSLKSDCLIMLTLSSDENK